MVTYTIKIEMNVIWLKGNYALKGCNREIFFTFYNNEQFLNALKHFYAFL